MRYLKSKIITKIIIYISHIIFFHPVSRQWIRSIQRANIIIFFRIPSTTLILIKQMSSIYWTNISSSSIIITEDSPAEDHIFPTVIITLPQLIINCLTNCDGSCLHQNFVLLGFRKIPRDVCVYWSLIVQI